MTSTRQVVTFARYSARRVGYTFQGRRPLSTGDRYPVKLMKNEDSYIRSAVIFEKYVIVGSSLLQKVENLLWRWSEKLRFYSWAVSKSIYEKKPRKEAARSAGLATIQSLAFSSTEIPRERTGPFSNVATIYFPLNRWFHLISTSTWFVIYLLDIPVKKQGFIIEFYNDESSYEWIYFYFEKIFLKG